MMNEKAKKYVDLFRKVKIASAATVDQEGHPRSRIINVMIAADEGMYIVTSKGKPFYEQLMNTGVTVQHHAARHPAGKIAVACI